MDKSDLGNKVIYAGEKIPDTKELAKKSKLQC